MGWFERLGAWSEDHRLAVDAAAAASLGFVLLLFSAAAGGLHWIVWTVLLITPLAWRRTRPVASVVAVYAVALAHLAVGAPVLPADVAVPVALYSVTVHGPVWAHRTAMASAVVGSVVVGVELGWRAGIGGLATATAGSAAFGTLFFLVVWAFGLLRRSRRETIEALVDRARRLEVERDQQAQIATAAERSRIAREMHDIVAHSLSVIIAQADGGRYAAAKDPAVAERALGVVAETGRAALADMRRLLGVLRTGGPGDVGVGGGFGGAGRGGGEPGAGVGGASSGTVQGGLPGDLPGGGTGPVLRELGPQPGVEDLDTLAEQVRSSGTPVSVVTVGTGRRLPPGLGLTVFRICQESLTNVMKHAGPGAGATVLVRWRPEAVEIEVLDDGRGAAAEPGAAGFGLVGMRERVAVYGGSLRTGPRPGGGYAVRASIPLPPGAGTPQSTED
ncbi:sensor histidine kinase [Cellulomonas sp. PhB143]|uniref:sensor histidine kinase n=1 Tax=Cellulomonas sp. PhB143 TaxID=2485186 RepID=UPI000F48C64D|nr:histidine kinase [Cellulomonas sp. PhB143]ROS78585.1 signal transduction histidine kinase [Cellulomonas sp. PhB143]